jgi:hypothetical protein
LDSLRVLSTSSIANNLSWDHMISPTLFRTILTQLLGQPVEVVENEELELTSTVLEQVVVLFF